MGIFRARGHRFVLFIFISAHTHTYTPSISSLNKHLNNTFTLVNNIPNAHPKNSNKRLPQEFQQETAPSPGDQSPFITTDLISAAATRSGQRAVAQHRRGRDPRPGYPKPHLPLGMLLSSVDAEQDEVGLFLSASADTRFRV
jgi:hypothetical protein